VNWSYLAILILINVDIQPALVEVIFSYLFIIDGTSSILTEVVVRLVRVAEYYYTSSACICSFFVAVFIISIISKYCHRYY
jgi:hypothetical protein